jgi:hypothetical protein
MFEAGANRIAHHEPRRFSDEHEQVRAAPALQLNISPARLYYPEAAQQKSEGRSQN